MNRSNGGYIGILKEDTSVYPFSGVYPLYEQQENKLAELWPDRADSNFANNSLLLKTTTQSTHSTTTTDSSVNNLTVTRNGAPSTAWTSPYQTVGYWSNYFNGSTDYLTVPNNAALALGSGNFTVELWFYKISTADGAVNDYASAGGFGFVIQNNNVQTFSSVGAIINFAGTININQWNHLAIVRNSGTLYCYLNGSSIGTPTADAKTYTSPSTFVIGKNAGASLQYFPGYISNLRIVNGTAVYTTAFTPSTTPLTAISGTSLLTCQNNRFIDNSTNNFTITRSGTPQVTSYYYPSGFTAPDASVGAAYFNGTSDYITAAAITPPGTGSVTYECSFYITSLPNSTVMNSRSGNTTDGIDMIVNSSGKIVATYTGLGLYTGGNFTIAVNTWYHLAFVRNGSSNWTVYLNGQVDGTFTSAVNITSTTFTLGLTLTGTSYFPGYISNVRVTNSAVYTGNFTPPTNFLTQTGGTYPSTANVDTSITSSNTKLLLNFSDSNFNSIANTSNNNAFIDSGPYAFPITRTGTPTQGSVTPYWPNGYWSNYFNGSTDLINGSSASLAFGTGNFTLEAWIYVNSLAATNGAVSTVPSTGGPGVNFSVMTNGKIRASIGNSGAGADFDSSSALSINTWYHVAFVRSGSTVTIYINGISVATGTNSSSIVTTEFIVGRGYTNLAASYFNGYISNARITNTAVYTSAFTPSTVPLTAVTGTLLLTAQSNRFKDNSASPLTVGVGGTPKVQYFQPFSPPTPYNPVTYGGSVYLPLTSTDYLQTPVSSAFASGTGDFTVECWVYATAVTDSYIWTQSVSGTNYFLLGFNTTAFFYMTASGGGTAINGPASSIVANSWNHIAVTRSNGTVRVFVNGVSGTATSNTTDLSNVSYVPTIGRYSHTASFGIWTGYISNLRYVKGNAVYTSNFTPPTTPVTAITGTGFLANFTNAGIYDASYGNDLITISNAQVSNTVVKWAGSNSIRFNGSTDYLSLPASSAFAFGTGDFTLECWIYTIAASDVGIYEGRASGSGTAGFTLTAFSSSVIRVYTGSSAIISSSGTSYFNVWTHVAVVRASGTTTLYINGTSVGTSASMGTLTDTTPVIGAGRYTGTTTPSAFFNGYIQDFRITKAARYTASFTPPVLPFLTL